jgi:hypothetical protein
MPINNATAALAITTDVMTARILEIFGVRRASLELTPRRTLILYPPTFKKWPRISRINTNSLSEIRGALL